MDDFIDFIKKIWSAIAYTISILSGIAGILSFFRIDYKNIVPIILLVLHKFKVYICELIKGITYRLRIAKIILFKQYCKIIKICHLQRRFREYLVFFLQRFYAAIISYIRKKYTFPMIIRIILCCLLFIIIFSSNILNCSDAESDIVKNDNLNQNEFYESTNYVQSHRASSQSTENVTNIDEVTLPYWWIKIEHQEGYPDINNYEFENLFNSLFYYNVNNFEEIVKNEIKILINSCRENISLDDSFTSNAYWYAILENELFGENKESSSSDDLDIIINGRKELLELYPNSKMAWLLANDYQIYAYNYLQQTTEADSILYFYMQSIYYAKESLEFDIDAEAKKTRIKYIQMRYKDIADCNIIEDEIRNRAKAIYCIIDNVLNISDLSSKENLLNMFIVNEEYVCQESSIFDSYGNIHTDALLYQDCGNITYYLDQRYSFLKFNLSMSENADINNSGILTIKADNDIVYLSPSLTKNNSSFDVIDIPIQNCSLLTIEYKSTGYNPCIMSNIEIYN